MIEEVELFPNLSVLAICVLASGSAAQANNASFILLSTVSNKYWRPSLY